MNSLERKKARRERRQRNRLEKKLKSCTNFDQYEKVFSYGNMYKSYQKCRKGVSWKSSVQKYITQAPLNVRLSQLKLLNDTFEAKGFYEFDINERGKTRHIKSVHIGERVVHGTVCDYSLVPMLSRTFIYDNGASLVNKGYHFSVKRLEAHLQKYYRKYGTEGYILIFDFSKFFDNVSHQLISDILNNEYSDRKIIDLVEYLISTFGNTGLGLGSPVSQILALSSANRLDHYIKEELGIKYYGRYMDDGYLIHNDKAYLIHCYEKILEMCKKLGIHLNKNKTHIIKLSHGFTYLKVRIKILPSGKIIKKMCKSSVARERRKLKKLRKMLDKSIVKSEDVYMSFQSWKAYAKQFNATQSIKNMQKLYDELFVC